MPSSDATQPNVVCVLADDLGYGDVDRYNPDSRIPTPHLDRLADAGRSFTDAHAPSAVCTPTRYALLTGRYCWRTELDAGVIRSWDPPLIDADRLTLPELLGEHGYHTACIGKWHLGWEWPTVDGRLASGYADAGADTEERRSRIEAVDFSEPIRGGPVDRGFDHYFGDDVPNMAPYGWIEDDRFVESPTKETPDGMFGVDGPMVPGWTLEQVMPGITARAVEYVERRATDDRPFFLYFSLTAPHTPIVPVQRFRGRSDAGAYGDYVCETDWALGQVLDALDRTGVADDTIVLFTSDNGPEHTGRGDYPEGMNANAYDRIREHGHYSMDGLRGIKRDTWEGGHRVPFIVRWPGEVPGGTECDEVIGLVDLVRTFASMLGTDLPADAGEDSVDIGPALRGETHEGPLREAIVYHGHDGSLALRKGDWVLIDAPTGDVNGAEPDWFREERGYEPHNQPGELYDLSVDRAQRDNLYADKPEKVAELRSLLDSYRDSGRRVPP